MMKLKICVFAVFAGLMLLPACSDKKSTLPNHDEDPQDGWSQVTSLWLGDYTRLPRGLLVDGKYLYVTGDGGFMGVVDISDPDTMKLIGYRASNGTGDPAPECFPRPMVKYGQFLLCLFRGSDARVDVFNVSNPTAPMLVYTLYPKQLPSESFDQLHLAGDTLAIDYALYRINADGSVTYLKRLISDDMTDCPYAGITDCWVGPEYWYFYGVCIDTTQHPKVWVLERGSMRPLHENSLPKEVDESYIFRGSDTGTRSYRLGEKKLFEIDATDPSAVTVSRTLQIPEDFNLSQEMILRNASLTAFGDYFVIKGEHVIVLLDQNFHYLEYDLIESYGRPARSGNTLYVTGLSTLVAYRLE